MPRPVKKILYYTCSHHSQDIGFWETVRSTLAARGCRLVIAATADTTYVVRADRRLNLWKLTPTDRLRSELEARLDWDRLRLCALGYGETFDRTGIIEQALNLNLHLALERPDLVLIYNDRRRVGNLLRQLCILHGLPSLVVERLPWPAWISVDPGGMLQDCELFRNIPEPSPEAQPLAREYERLAGSNATTWWTQPQDRSSAHLDALIPPGKRVLLFAHQVDEDAQNFAYNPHFKDNAEALSWIVRSLPEDESVFVLGKHHPKATTPPALYSGILGRHGCWSTTHTMEECLARADAVVAVNSSLLFEAILTGKPVGSLGQTVLHDCGVFDQLSSPADTSYVSRLLGTPAHEIKSRKERFLHYTQHCLERAFCLKPQSGPNYGRRGAEALADFLATQIPAEPPAGLEGLVSDATECLDSALTLHTWMTRSRPMKLVWRLSRAVNSLLHRS